MSIEIAKTRYGVLQGVKSTGKGFEDIVSFKGIRYAAPPVGELRFKPPEAPECFDGVRLCDTYGPRPMQPQMGDLGNEPYSSDFYYDGFPEMSEDCLFLNVTTGAVSADEKRPVFMWFHGGGLATGFSYEHEFESSVLAKKGIVVVTVGQRLNVMGYLALPQLSAEQGGVSGNYGLMDEVMALDWVTENIAAFGGDPDNITVGGQSGGTAKSGALAGSPMQKGRVKRVINQSNLNWAGRDHQTIEEAEKAGREYLKIKGIDPDITLAELRALPADSFYQNVGMHDMRIGCLTVDGTYVKYADNYKAIDEFACDCDYLTGGNYGETSLDKNYRLGPDTKMPVITEETYYEVAKNQLGGLYEKYDFERNYGLKPGDNADHLSRWYASLGLNPNGLIRNRYFGAYRKEKGMKGKTYSYLFAHVTPTYPEEQGTARDMDKLLAWHSSELWYTFASLRRSADGSANEPACRPWTEYDEKLADMMSSYWANFMKNGDPNGDELPFWPESDENYGYMILGDAVEGHSGLDSDFDKLALEHLLTEGKKRGVIPE
jgi:para-nitrobenzyl esterase